MAVSIDHSCTSVYLFSLDELHRTLRPMRRLHSEAAISERTRLRLLLVLSHCCRTVDRLWA
eukprot:4123725-Amphidinium_carterae.1